jgi:hypothetical protein
MAASVLKTLWRHWHATGFGDSLHLCFAPYLPTFSLNKFSDAARSLLFKSQIMRGRTVTVNEMEF